MTDRSANMENVKGLENRTPVKSEVGNSKKERSVEETYRKMTQLEHILLRPDTYIGSVESTTEKIWVYNPETAEMNCRDVTFVPGLYKIFDEVLVNAADNKQRDPNMDQLRVEVDQEAGTISVMNNGAGIPIEMHKEHNMYVPELIFGHLLTSSNYDDSQEKTTGGRNGYGAKLANIFSREFIVECQDAKRGLRFKQVFSNNMKDRTKAFIKKSKKADFVKITFTPDLQAFGFPEEQKGFTDDLMHLFAKRVADMAGTCPAGLKVFFNGKRLPIKNFHDYVKKFFAAQLKEIEQAQAQAMAAESEVLADLGVGEEKQAKRKRSPVVYCELNEHWKVAVAPSEGTFQQVSFVNAINTMHGGSHVRYIADKVARAIKQRIEKKHKKVKLTVGEVKNHMWIFVNSLIVNPAFDSQTKLTLMTKSTKFGSTCQLEEKFIKQVMNCGIVGRILDYAAHKSKRALKKNDGRKERMLRGIDKLEDANDAGTAKGHLCTLILTEGDSAKALAVSGLSVVGRDRYGVFPLKGKLLNVREATSTQITKNEEISNLKRILGLKNGVEYKNTKRLRYGHVMVMTDQDHDGSHIKGLVINFFHRFWPSLLKIPGFLTEFITPIVKVTKGKRDKRSFYTIPEYEQWKQENGEGRGWKIKYYKGLGTSTAAEAKEYFSDLDEHCIDFEYNGGQDDAMIDLVFSKKKANARKQWLAQYQPGTFLQQRNRTTLGLSEFINKELILFSMASNERAIPSLVDGLKPGQRKIMYCAFKRNLVKDIKVAQFAGYVSEHSAYHHGEMSLNGTIICLAQDFVGSNNVNLLVPSGMFGTRHEGGKDSASPRYVFTRMHSLTRLLFHESDDSTLTHLTDDGMRIEPQWYMPVLPTVLINGSAGIGTGWSSNIPNYNPHDIARNIKRMLGGEQPEAMIPWYRGFHGDIVCKTDRKGQVKDGQYSVYGKYVEESETMVRVTEIPVQKWTHDYKKFLETLCKSGVLKDFKEYHTDSCVEFLLEFKSAEELTKLKNATGGLSKSLHLKSSITTSNMVLFTQDGRLKRYATATEILEDFYPLRLSYYRKRKENMVAHLTQQVSVLQNRVRFIRYIIDGSITINNVPKADIVDQLTSLGFSPAEDTEDDFDYLLSMKLWSLTQEKVETLEAEQARRTEELDELLATQPKNMWMADIDAFLEAYESDLQGKLAEEADEDETKMERKTSKKAGGKKKKAAPRRKPAARSKATKAKKAAPSVAQVTEQLASISLVPPPVVFDDSDDEFMSQMQAGSLAERVQSRMATKARKPTVAKKPAKKPAKKAAVAKKPAAKKTASKKAPVKKAPVVKKVVPTEEEAVVVEEKTAEPPTPVATPVSAKPKAKAASKKPARKPAARKSKKAVEESDDDAMFSDMSGSDSEFSADDDVSSAEENDWEPSDSDDDGESKRPAPAKAASRSTARRARARVNYATIDASSDEEMSDGEEGEGSDESDDQGSSSEEESESGSEFEEGEESESEYDGSDDGSDEDY